MEKIWAPWRSHSRMEEGYTRWECLFCGLSGDDNDKRNLIVRRGEKSFTVMNLYPYNSGHLMVAPYRHTSEFETLTADEIMDIHNELQLAVKIIKEIYKPEGMNIGLNLGRAAGAGVAEHLHYHIVPRWTGDSNFMPVIGKTKVISVDLEESYEKLISVYKKYQIS